MTDLERRLMEANAKLVGALNLIHATLHGAEVQDLIYTINEALALHDLTLKDWDAVKRAQE